MLHNIFFTLLMLFLHCFFALICLIYAVKL